jgi:hypothetical protein
MTIDARRWKFLRPEKAGNYIEMYERVRDDGWKTLVASTTRRQFATAREILDRMNQGQQGVLLADDAGLGKTTVAAFCALVFAGSGKKVRILAPNEMMARRWRQELEIHIGAFARFRQHLKLERAQRRLGQDMKKLTDGAIAVSTHLKAGHLACNLLVIDEAHRTRSERSALAQRVRRHSKAINHLLVLTATPFSIDANDLARLLARIGGKAAEKPMRNYARIVDDLWRGRSSGAPEDLAQRLSDAARAAVDAMRPFVIRHGVDDLRASERRAFGTVADESEAKAPDVPDGLLEAMLRTDRALALGRKCKAWRATKLNDPRYHVASTKLDADLSAVLESVTGSTDDAATLTRHHGQIAQKLIRANGIHPKIVDTIKSTCAFVEQGEKVLIFCDHHLPAVELSTNLAQELRWPTAYGEGPTRLVWWDAWSRIFAEIRLEGETGHRSGSSVTRLEHYLDWLVSNGVRHQIRSWLGADLQPSTSVTDLKRLLEKTRARGLSACSPIAAHAKRLYRQLVDRESGSTRAILLRADAARLPGTTMARVAAVCEPESNSPLLHEIPGIFYSTQPDATLAVFNSPFGPDVLVATDRLSEGVDLHQFCRHLIHHELDPSPVRTIQRNGRLRRVNSWAARTGQPLRILYPALRGTRDEKLVQIMRYRLSQFNLLLGGVGAEIDPEESEANRSTYKDVIRLAQERLAGIRLCLN